MNHSFSHRPSSLRTTAAALLGFAASSHPARAAIAPDAFAAPVRQAVAHVGWDTRLEGNFNPNYDTGGMNRRFEGGFDQRFDHGGLDNRFDRNVNRNFDRRLDRPPHGS